MSSCESFDISKERKNENDMDLTIRIKKLKSPKRLEVEATTLPPGSD
jgi:hypothetical protein